MKINIDNPIITGMGKAADLIIVNVLTILLCLPVITAGAAFTALNYSCIKIRRDEESNIFKLYFHSFSSNFRQATILWLIMLLSVLFTIYLLWVMRVNNLGGEATIIIFGAIVLLECFLYIMVFPILSKFGNTIFGTLKTAIYVSFANAPKSLLMIIITIAPIYLCYCYFKLLPLGIMFGFSGPAFISALLFNKYFLSMEDKVNERLGVPKSGSQDEHIFTEDFIELK